MKQLYEIVDVGNSFGVRIPLKLLKENDVKKGDKISFEFEKVETEMKPYIVSWLDQKSIIVELKSQDELVSLNTGIPQIVDYIRKKDYKLTRDQYLRLVEEWH